MSERCDNCQHGKAAHICSARSCTWIVGQSWCACPRFKAPAASDVSATDTYRRHAVPLSPAEQELWDRPAAEESLVERIAMGMYVLTEAAEMCEWPDADQQLWLDCAQVAIDIVAGRTA